MSRAARCKPRGKKVAIDIASFKLRAFRHDAPSYFRSTETTQHGYRAELAHTFAGGRQLFYIAPATSELSWPRACSIQAMCWLIRSERVVCDLRWADPLQIFSVSGPVPSQRSVPLTVLSTVNDLSYILASRVNKPFPVQRQHPEASTTLTYAHAGYSVCSTSPVVGARPVVRFLDGPMSPTRMANFEPL